MNTEELLEYLKSEQYVPSTTTAIAKKLGKNPKEIKKILEILEDEDLIYRSKNWKWHVVPEDEMIGEIKFTRSGRKAFVTSFSGKEAFVEVADTLWALNGDKVLVKLFEVRGDEIPHGKVIRILQRALKMIVGVYRAQGTNFGYIVPDDSKIIYEFRVSRDDSMNASDKDKVVGEIIKYPSEESEGMAKVTAILGKADSHEVDIPSILAKYQLPNPGEFPSSVLKEVRKLPKKILAKDLEGRKDLRKKHIFTIDGEDSKDFDDAVSIDMLPNGNYLLGVHIADVSHYVKEGSAIDKEAFKRGTSVYLLSTVIPMLPFELSNDLCSLVEGEDRLAVSVEMEIDEYGRVVKKDFFKSVIRSVKRLTYGKVTKLLEDPDDKLRKEIGFLEEELKTMARLAHTLKTSRLGRGAMEFESNDVKVILDDNGEVEDIVLRKQTVSEAMIEEFMIMANEAVAEIFDIRQIPFIYRVHSRPDPEALEKLSEYLKALGLNFKITEDVQPILLQRILEQIRGHPLESIIQRLLVRSMKKAVYSETNVGHFGLASLNYTHFTSPIRRYPDLVVHRLLKAYIDNGSFKKKQIKKYMELLPIVAHQSSKREIVADQAERDLIALKKVEYMQQHIGEVFDVVITDVTEFGIFVEIPDKAISGLIHISSLNDYYTYDQKTNALIGERTGKIFKLGDKLRAKAVSVDKTKGQVDFILEEDGDNGRKGKRKTNKSSKKNRRSSKRHSNNGKRGKGMH
ncbi:ribonuclease R [Mesoaciditoga lauensis]|uniref:ribonuclease R n=1 Tax=Mesoaciditoga lauensis TaxID=1495039 RepID=UPI0005675E2A|nr:ribonuclease R [Mesoaciditoga lauensis]